MMTIKYPEDFALNRVSLPQVQGAGYTWGNDAVTVTGELTLEQQAAIRAAVLNAGSGPVVSAQPSYRERRAVDYIAELSPEATFATGVGDLIDAIIKALDGDPTELDALKVKILEIKGRWPKPEE